MKIAFVGAQDRPHELACTHWSGIHSASKRLDHEIKVFCCRSGEGFIDQLIAWKPDVMVYNLIDMAENENWRIRLREKLPNAKIVFWYTDCRTPDTDQITVDLKGTVDLFLVSNDGLKDFQTKHFGMTPEFLPQASEPLPEKPPYNPKADYGFLFVGGKINRKGFVERMNFVHELEKNYNLKVINGHTPSERAKVYQSMPQLYSSTPFNLDISHFWDIPKYTSNRYWVIPAFWGFSLTKRFPQHEELFPESVRVYWDTIEELMEKIEYYKNHEEERQEMIRKGWEHAKNNHTYSHRIEKILDKLRVV